MARPYKLKVYRSRDGWRWRLRAPNGQIVATNGEALTGSPRRCYNAATKVLRGLAVDGFKDAEMDWRL